MAGQVAVLVKMNFGGGSCRGRVSCHLALEVETMRAVAVAEADLAVDSVEVVLAVDKAEVDNGAVDEVVGTEM